MAASDSSIKNISDATVEEARDEKIAGDVTEPTSDVSESGKDDAPALPFSKARCIALVATVTGASFLNVGPTSTRSRN